MLEQVAHGTDIQSRELVGPHELLRMDNAPLTTSASVTSTCVVACCCDQCRISSERAYPTGVLLERSEPDHTAGDTQVLVTDAGRCDWRRDPDQ